MTVRELMALLATMPQDVEVEVNDQRGGEVYAVEHCFLAPADRYDPEAVIIAVNS